jgi:hypothetical protein
MQLVRRIWRFALLGLWVATAGAVELKQNKFTAGTAGLVPVPVTVGNNSNEAITCTAEYAHWYSSEVGAAAPGSKMQIALWFETATGAYVMLNERQENLPVESLWCGIAGRAYVTRGLLPLHRIAGAPASARAVTCIAKGDRLSCE